MRPAINTSDGRRLVSRRGFLKIAAAGAAAAAVPSFVRAKRPPNFVIIFTDDQGYQDLGCFGSPKIKTPCIDRMAAEGMRFTDFYVASPICTPSRSALMTGCYPKRVGLARGVLFPQANRGLNPSEITIAEVLKSRGYATGCIGKWHLGDNEKFLPRKQGFDSYFGIPYSNDMGHRVKPKKGVPLLRNETVVEHPARQETLTQRYTEEAVRFVKENARKPFFLYLAHTFPHVPLYAAPPFKGISARGLYGDVIECIDWSTGVLVKALRTLGIERDTIVVFTSDNGPWLSKGKNGGCALPLRGGKQTTWEGGMREPCVMWAPGRIPAGSVCSEVAASMDLLPTFARIAGASAPTDRVIDGHDIAPLMFGERGAKSPWDAFYYYNTGGALEAVRAGDWKLRIPRRRRKGEEKGLYNLRAEVSEKTNLITRHPDVAARLEAMMKKFDADLAKTSRPVGRV